METKNTDPWSHGSIENGRGIQQLQISKKLFGFTIMV